MAKMLRHAVRERFWICDNRHCVSGIDATWPRFAKKQQRVIEKRSWKREAADAARG